MPVFNAEAFLPQCLSSIERQSMRGFECLIVMAQPTPRRPYWMGGRGKMCSDELFTGPIGVLWGASIYLDLRDHHGHREVGNPALTTADLAGAGALYLVDPQD